MPDFMLEDRVALTKMVLATLKGWGANEAQQILLLALPGTTKPRHWLKRRNRRFGNRRPLEIMLEDGINGVLAIRTHLDCAYDWHRDDQKNRY
jgi:Antitoxin Xre/MbcA/ParS C-terminal toxin-binding domain